jgi:hypothetical protein
VIDVIINYVNEKYPLKDKKIIRERILWKLKKKPKYYLYCREHKPLKFFTHLIINEQ